MPKFYVTDSVALEVAYVYEVEAGSPEEARQAFEDDKSAYFGHALGKLVHDYDKIEVRERPPKELFEPLGPGRD